MGMIYLRRHAKRSLISILTAAGCIGSALTQGANAASDAARPPEPASEWTLTISPYIWAASLNGHATLAGFRAPVKAPFSQIFDDLDFTLMGNVELSNGRYGGYLDGQYTQTSTKNSIDGQDVRTHLTATTLTGGVFLRALEVPLSGQTVFGKQRVFALEPTAGVRWTKLKGRLDAGPYEVSRGSEWTDPFVGVRLFADLNDRWNVFAEADVGGFGVGSKLSANGQAYLGYRSFILGHPVLFRVGYRALYQDYSNGGSGASQFRWKTTQHGPVMGMSMEF